MTDEIKQEDLEELQGFVDCGFNEIQLARIAYKIGRVSVRKEILTATICEAEELALFRQLNPTATSTPAGIGKVNGSDIDTTTPLPESLPEDERPAACNDKCGDKADSRSLPQVRLGFENHKWVVRNLDRSLFCCRIPRYTNDACDNKCVNYSETPNYGHILCRGIVVAEIVDPPIEKGK